MNKAAEEHDKRSARCCTRRSPDRSVAGPAVDLRVEHRRRKAGEQYLESVLAAAKKGRFHPVWCSSDSACASDRVRMAGRDPYKEDAARRKSVTPAAAAAVDADMEEIGELVKGSAHYLLGASYACSTALTAALLHVRLGFPGRPAGAAGVAVQSVTGHVYFLSPELAPFVTRCGPATHHIAPPSRVSDQAGFCSHSGRRGCLKSLGCVLPDSSVWVQGAMQPLHTPALQACLHLLPASALLWLSADGEALTVGAVHASLVPVTLTFVQVCRCQAFEAELDIWTGLQHT